MFKGNGSKLSQTVKRSPTPRFSRAQSCRLAPLLLICTFVSAPASTIATASIGVAARAIDSIPSDRQQSTNQQDEQQRVLNEITLLFQQVIKLEREHKYDEAIPIAQRLVAASEKAYGVNGQGVATALVQLARLRSSNNQNNLAEPLNRRALEIAEKTLGPENPLIELFTSALASVAGKLGDYKRSAALYERTLALETKLYGPDNPELSLTLLTLGDAYRRMADYARAEATLQRAIQLREKAGGDPSEMIAPLDTLAGLYVDRGDYSRAEEIQLRTLDLREKAFGKDHFLFAVGLINGATTYREQGDFVTAEQYLQRALPIFEKALGADDPRLATLLSNLASLYESVGDGDRAEKLLLRALSIDEKVFGGEHIEAGRDRHNLANFYLQRRDYERAEPLFQKALEIREKTLGPDHPELAVTLNGLGVLYGDKKDYERAAALLERALSIRQKAFGADHPSVGLTLNNVAALAQEQGNYDRAATLYEKALQNQEKALGPRHPDIAILVNNIAILNEARGEPERALAFVARGNEIREQTLALVLTTGSERRKLSYVESFAPETNYTVSLHFKTLPANVDAARLSLTTILRRKGRGLDAMTDQVSALRRRLDPADQRLLDQLSDARTRLAALMLNGVGQGDPAQHEASINELRTAIDEMEALVSSRSAEFRATVQPVTLDHVQEAIPAGAALIEIVQYRPVDARAQKREAARYAAYVMRRDGPLSWVDLGDAAEIDAALAEWRKALADPARNEVRQLARSVDERVMRPVRKLLADATRQLFISPDGAFNLVPFAAFVDEKDRYLVERYAITYLTSGRDLLRLRAKGVVRGGPLVVADPTFDTASAVQNTSRPVGTKEVRRSVDLADARFARLPGTAGEARALGEIMPGSAVLTGGRATEAAIKSAKSPKVLHIATHGFFLSTQSGAKVQDSRGIKLATRESASPPSENLLLRSGLALAGANARHSDGGEDGILTALETAGLDLWGTKLVVLSACETGLGDVKNGDGVYGLKRALVLAGSESQVISLWQVSDEATRDLMVEYYKRLENGEGRTEALRQVQLTMIKGGRTSAGGPKRGIDARSDGPSARSHPFFWASFIQSGEWRPMNAK